MFGAKPQFDVLNAGPITSREEQFERFAQVFTRLGVCAMCGYPVFQVEDYKDKYPYFAPVQQYKGLQCLSATKSGETVACHYKLDCINLFKDTTTGKAHFSRVLGATTSKKSSHSCELNGCTSPPTIKRELKNGSLQWWCKPCLDSYYTALNDSRSPAIKHAGGLGNAKRSQKRTDGKVLGKCMECSERVLDAHENMVALQGCFVHIGCLG
jgi:hypothetical protein